MPSTPLALRESIEPAALRPVVYEAFMLVAMLVVLGLGTLLPGAGRTIPSSAVTIRAVIEAIGTVGIVVWLAHSIPAVARFTRASLIGPDDLIADLGRVAGALVAFLGVLVAYRGLAGVVIPTMAAHEAVWAYDAAFLMAGLVPLAVVANRLRRNREVVTDLVTAAIASDQSFGTDEPVDTP